MIREIAVRNRDVNLSSMPFPPPLSEQSKGTVPTPLIRAIYDRNKSTTATANGQYNTKTILLFDRNRNKFCGGWIATTMIIMMPVQPQTRLDIVSVQAVQRIDRMGRNQKKSDI